MEEGSGRGQIDIICLNGTTSMGSPIDQSPQKVWEIVECTLHNLLSTTNGCQATKIFSKDGKTSHQSKTPHMDWNHP